MAIVAGSLIFRPNRCVRNGRSCGRVLYIGVTERKSHVARIIEILERDGQISRNQCRSMFPARHSGLAPYLKMKKPCGIYAARSSRLSASL
jgi:hypothetical protein